MIIKITQTSSNVRQSYDIEGNDFYYHGKAGSVSRRQSITLTSKTEILEGRYHASHITNYIPFRYLFGGVNLTRVFDVCRNGEHIGTVLLSKCGFLKNFYTIALNDNTCLHCYTVAKGSFQYVCIYKYGNDGSEQQIALVETYLNVDNFKYAHKVYLLDDYKQLAPVISFFAVYYSSYNFSKRFHMSSGSVNEKRITFSKYNDKYDASWRETHFPEENFFGKVNLFSVK